MATPVTNGTIKENTFKTIYNLINGSKPTGWTIVSSFPDSNPTFPCIIINPAKVSVKSDFLRILNRDYEIEVEIEFFAKSSSRKEVLDQAIDDVRELILDGSSTLETNSLALFSDNPVDETDVGTIVIGKTKLHTASMLIMLRKI